MNIQILLIISSLCSVFGSSSEENPQVRIPQGVLQGTILLTKNGRNISAFQGIPYAEPPIKELRFSNPVPAKGWDGVYLADENGNSCPQTIPPANNEIMGEEDCLYINVFTPLLDFESKLLEDYTIFITDSGFFYPQVLVLENRARVAESPFYLYSFTYHGNVTEMVPHAQELEYLFSKNYTHPISDKDECVIDIMVDLWTSFAINGTPTTVYLENSDMWLPYTEKNSFLQIGNLNNQADPVVTIEDDYFTNRMNFWKDTVSW